MKKFLFVFFCLTSSYLSSQNKVYAFVGKKISVEEVPNKNNFYFKYKNVYAIEQQLSQKIESDTIIFYSHSHLKKIQYKIFDLAIIYLKKNKSGELEHFRTYFTPIILNKDGKWMGYNYYNESNDGYEKQNNSPIFNIKKNIQIVEIIEPQLKGNSKILYKYLKAYFPKRFFRYKGKYRVQPQYLKTAEQLMEEQFQSSNWK